MNHKKLLKALENVPDEDIRYITSSTDVAQCRHAIARCLSDYNDDVVFDIVKWLREPTPRIIYDIIGHTDLVDAVTNTHEGTVKEFRMFLNMIADAIDDGCYIVRDEDSLSNRLRMARPTRGREADKALRNEAADRIEELESALAAMNRVFHFKNDE